MLSQIERRAANPTLAVTFRIAQAFRLSIGDLVKGAHDDRRIEVVRGDDPAALFRDDAVVRIRTLSPLFLEKDVEFYEVILEPGRTLDSSAHFAGTREFLTVCRGSVVVTSGDESTTLKKGDSAQFPADVPHSIHNPGKAVAEFFLVDIYSKP
jgi:mannose-6-phosphate isomerase-like protein (cupin superfamily)